MSQDLPPLDELSAFAERLADASGEVIRGYFRQRLAVEDKPDDSPVTEADRAAEQAIRKLIEPVFPDHGVYGEEFGQRMGERYTWVLDPIDGTKSFINGMPTFGTLIALLDGERPVLGLIDAPALGERWFGAAGQATQYRSSAAYGKNASCQTSGRQRLAEASMLSTSIDMFRGSNFDRYQAISAAVKRRRFGGDCYAYGLLALGFVDLVVEASMEPYDYLAMAPIVEHAGGVISDWGGEPLQLRGPGTVVAAATKALHDEALAVLRS